MTLCCAGRGPPTFPQLRQWCFLRMTVKGALQAVQKPQASSGTHSGGSVTMRMGDTSARGTTRQLQWGPLGWTGAGGPRRAGAAGRPAARPPHVRPCPARITGLGGAPASHGRRPSQLRAVPVHRTPAAAFPHPGLRTWARGSTWRPSPQPLSARQVPARPLGKVVGGGLRNKEINALRRPSPPTPRPVSAPRPAPRAYPCCPSPSAVLRLGGGSR